MAQFDKNTTKEMLQAALTGSKLGVWVWDLRNNHVYYDDMWLELVGYKAGELANDFSTWEQLTHPDGVKRAKEKIAAHLADQNTPYIVPFRMRHKAGHWVWILARGGISHYDDDGNPIFFVGTHEDITENKKQEQEKLEAKQRFELAIQGSQNGIWDWNVITSEVFYSEIFKNILGYSGDEFPHHFDSFANSLHADDRERVLAAVDRHLVEKDPYNIEYRLRHKDGHYVHCRAKGQALWNEAGKPIRMSGSLYDITQEKETEKRLAQSQKLDSIGQLAGGVAHDFNNILGSIIGFSSLIKEEASEGTLIANYADKIEHTAQRGASLTKRLLGFARQGLSAKNEVDICELFNAACLILDRLIDKRITIKKDCPDTVNHIEGDQHQLEQVLINLCINARDAIEGRGTITFTACNFHIEKTKQCLFGELSQGDYVKITVADTGSGIDQAILDKIFEPFFTTKDVDKGTGLGLAMAQGIINNHHGQLDVQSIVGQGTTIDIYLPLFKNNEITDDTSHAGNLELQSKKTEEQLLESLLIADDEEDICEVLSALLEPYCKNITCVSNGEAAVNAYRSQHIPYDLVILDVIMPEMDGVTAYKAIKETNKDAKVIFASGYTGSQRIDELENHNDFAYLSKPFTRQQLLETIKALLY